ncbi:putative efflux pump kojT, partial [Fusarium oxysporum]
MHLYLQYRRLQAAVHSQVVQEPAFIAWLAKHLHSPALRHYQGTDPESAIEHTPAIVTDLDLDTNWSKDVNQQRFPSQEIPPSPLAGVKVVTHTSHDGALIHTLLVTWEGPDDKLNPRNWSLAKRLAITVQISILALFVIAASATDIAVLPQAAAELGVSEVAESLATGLFLVGMGVGSLVAGPFSETFGRSLVYIGSLFVFMIWIMASALAPNFAAQLCFRFLAGCCSSTPLVCTGGSISDMFTPAEKTWAFPIYAITSFGGPMLGAVLAAYVGPSEAVTWRWAEWIILIASGVVLVIFIFCMPETYGPMLLQWRAKHLRATTGDIRFVSEHEIDDASILSRLKLSMTRPFRMLREPTIMAMSLYLTVVYVVMFMFLAGWPYIFEHPYRLNQGLASIIFVAMLIGTQLNYIVVYVVWKLTENSLARPGSGRKADPEIRLYYSIPGAIMFPVSLFWMGWTARESISIWSPIFASGLFGFAVTGIFISAYMYIIDAYEVFAASALTFLSLVRYTVAGGMTVVGIPFYRNMGTNYTLTILGCLAALLVPIPFVFYYHGHRIRKH